MVLSWSIQRFVFRMKRCFALCDPGATKANQLQGDDYRRSEGCRCRAEKQGHSGKKLEGGRLEDFHVVTLDAKNSDQISRKTHWDG